VSDLTTVVDHNNKWGSFRLMNIYYVVRVIAISFPGVGVKINNISKEGIFYHVTICIIPMCTCLDLMKMPSHALVNKGK
jgi:hypothetical protein